MIAMAMACEPDLLLLDEPFSALDAFTRASLQRDVRSIAKELGINLVMVTHDIAEAAFFGHTLVLMRDGRIVQTGSLRELARAPADPFVVEFISAQREPMAQLYRVLE